MAQKNTKLLDWGIFLVSTVLCLYLLSMGNPWFWVTLPFVLTFLVKGLDAM
jgi:hypothetical protein